MEDLQQVAFLALLDALEGWKAETGTFLNWYALRLKSAFTEATGQRTQRDRLDPLDHADRLETPLGDDPDSGTLMDIIPDQAAERAVEDIAERDFTLHRRAAVQQALQSLTATQQKAVVMRYWNGQPVDSRALQSALRALRYPRVSKQLRVFL